MIELKPAPFGTLFQPRFISHRADLKPPFGGSWDVLGRMGSHFAVGVRLPRLLQDDALEWLADLTSAETDTVLMAWPQAGVELRGKSGPVVVDGDDQAGTTLSVKNGVAAYPLRKGQFVSLKVDLGDGVYQRFLHMIRTTVRLDADGKADLPITPMLRVSPPDGTEVEIERPMIEGRLSPGLEWDVDLVQSVGLAFEIEERE